MRTTIRRDLCFALMILAGTAASTARAQDDASAEPASAASTVKNTDSIWTRNMLTGDWGGLRSGLSDHGIDVGLRLSQYGQRVSSGGREENGEWGGTMDYRVKLDGKKLVGSWDGLSIDMHARTRWGEDVLADAGGLTIPNTGLLMPKPGDYSGTQITGLTVNQFFPAGDEHLGMATVGKLDILDAVTLFFPSVGNGQEGFTNVHSLVSALPWFGAVDGLSLYGGWLATINKERQIGQSAILVTGTENVTTSWGVQDSFEDGVWVAAFHRFLYKLDDKPGYFMIFGGFSTREQASNDPHDFAFKPGEGIVNNDEDKPWDIALYLSQVLWQEKDNPDRKATILIGGTGGPDNPQFAQYNFFTAVEGYGLFASRPHDRMGVAGWYNWLSDDFKELVSPAADLQDFYGFELYYNYQVIPSVHLTANIQLIENEFKEDDMAVIPGVRLVVDF